MCLIAVKNGKDAKFSIENFDKSYARNSDGMGIMFLQNGRVKVERVLGSLKQQRKVYVQHMNRPLFVMHQRFATHGSKKLMLENCHPYKVMDMDDGDPLDIYMAHNGVIHDVETSDKDMSDTWNFIENHIKPIIKAKPELLWEAGVQMMISKYIGSTNKLVFLTNANGEGYSPLIIFNKSSGTEVNGCWLSNTYSIANQTVYKNTYEKWYGANDDYDDAYGYAGSRRTYQSNRDWEYHNGKYLYDGKEFDDWDAFNSYKQANTPTEKELDLANTSNLHTVSGIPALVDHRGNEIKKNSYSTEESKEAQDIAKYKKDLRDCVVDGSLTIDDVKSEFTEEELELLQEELMELLDNEVKALCDSVRAIYDPENVDKNAMQILVDKVVKECNYTDLEALVDHEPQVAADMLEFLLEAYSRQQSIKAA